MKNIMWVCLLMALIAALIYVLMARGIMHAGDIAADEKLPAYFYVVPGGYVLGGFLVLLKRRWLWITGSVINGFGITMFYVAYAARPDIMLSAPGLITKIAQVILEIGLIYLIITFKRKEATS